MLLHQSILLVGIFGGIQTTLAFPTSTITSADTTSSLSSTQASQTFFIRQTAPSPTLPPSKGYFLTTQYIVIDGFTNAYATEHPKTITLALPTCHQTIIPDRNGYVPPGTCGAMYNYYPSFNAALATAVLFGILTTLHLCLAVIYKKSFCWVIIMGCLWETVGFAIRTASTRQQQTSVLVLISQLFVLLVPLWINAYIYILLAHLVNYVSPTHSILRIPAPILSIVFVVLDFVSFVIQMVGGALAGPMASEEEKMKGIHLYMGGIGLQQFFIVIFIGIAVKFHLEMKALQKRGILKADINKDWESLLWAVYVGLGFITIRIIYRLIEFSAGHDQAKNPLPYKEIYLYILEVLPMFLAIAVFLAVHPGRVLVGASAKMPGVWATLKRRRVREDEETRMLAEEVKMTGNLSKV